MTCDEADGLLCDYINRRLDTAGNSAMAVHLAKCPACRKEAAALIRLRGELQKCAEEPSESVLLYIEKIFVKRTVLQIVTDALSPVAEVLKLTRSVLNLAAVAAENT